MLQGKHILLKWLLIVFSFDFLNQYNLFTNPSTIVTSTKIYNINMKSSKIHQEQLSEIFLGIYVDIFWFLFVE